MRAVLISLPQPGEGEQPIIAGKTIAERQLLFARESGCTLAIAHGGGASPEAIALRHAAEKAGMRFQTVGTSHALHGAIADEDSLLVLQPGLLPEASQALELLRADGDRALVLSAGPGTRAGFERIDLDRAWAGAMTMPGRWLGALEQLPEDAAPHAALLRIALQKRLPEARLADGLLDEGRWQVIGDREIATLREKSWLRAHLGEAAGVSPSRWIARQVVERFGATLSGRRGSDWAALTLAAGSAAGGVAAAIYDRPALAFVLIALASPLLETFLTLRQLGAAPFGRIGKVKWLRRLLDVAILAAGVLSIDSLVHRIVFPPLVLAAGLLLLDRGQSRPAIAPLRDRMVVAGALAVLSAFASAEIAIMLVALIVLAAKLLPEPGERG